MLLSIIVPLYNKAKTVRTCIESITKQGFEDYEIVVVDDGSTDDSYTLVSNIQSDKIQIYKIENGGPASARNYGIKQAKGKWILFIDADDYLEPDALNTIAKNIKKHHFVDVFTFNLYMLRNGEKNVRNIEHTKGYLPFPFLNYYLDEIYPRTGNMVCKRRIMLEEPYNERLRRHEDTENTFRLMRKYMFYACPIPLFSYNQDTLAACFRRDNVEEDFTCCMQPNGKSFFEQMCMYKLYISDVCITYKDIVDSFYNRTFNKMKYGRGDKYMRLYKRLKTRIRNYGESLVRLLS